MKIMVCGSIGYGGLDKIKKTQSFLKKHGFTVIDQTNKDSGLARFKDFRDEIKLAEKIVKSDLSFVKKSDIIVAITDTPSYGTAMEIFAAKKSGKKIVILCEKKIHTPWPIAFSDHTVKSKKELIKCLKSLSASKV